jgi:hypothetical protein
MAMLNNQRVDTIHPPVSSYCPSEGGTRSEDPRVDAAPQRPQAVPLCHLENVCIQAELVSLGIFFEKS